MGQQIAHSIIKTNLRARLVRGCMLLGFFWFNAVQAKAQVGDPNARNSAATGANAHVHDAKSLADLLRPRLPKGWTISLKGEQVVLERVEPIEFYQGIGVPAPSESESERREFHKDYVRRGKLIV